MTDPSRGRVHAVPMPGCLMPLLLAVFMAIPLAELALLAWAVGRVGLGWTLLACILTAVAGSAIARWQGAVVLARAREALSRGEFPADAVLHGVLLLVGGVLLLTPGFVTDALGLLLLLPPGRAALARLARRWWRARMPAPTVAPSHPSRASWPGSASPRTSAPPDVIDVEPEQ